MRKRVAVTITITILVIMYISSSMTYQEQTIVPQLQEWLPHEPFLSVLRHIEIHYANEVVSVKTWGYYPFVEFLLRKLAHLTVFAVLAFGLFFVILDYTNTNWITFLVAWLSSTGLAAFDEYHQFLTGGRTPAVQDIMIDSVGAFVASLCCMLAVFIISRMRRRKTS